MNLSLEHQEMLLAVKASDAPGLFPEFPAEELRKFRRRLQKARDERLYRQRHYVVSSDYSFSERTQNQFEEAVRSGSEQLSNALHRHFRKWEDDNGFIAGAGQILLPAGYGDQRLAA